MANTPKDEFFIYTYPLGHVIKAHVEMADTNDDILLLVLESSVPVRVTPVFQGATYDGEAITIIGNGLGSMKWIVSHGVVSGTEQDYLLTDAHINPGNSGGPWFNDKGEIVALSDWGIGPAPHMIGIAGGVSAKRINEVLLSYKRMQDFAARLQKLFGGAI
jgi:serine protease Do